VIEKATQAGFQCVFVSYRTCQGVENKACKFFALCSWKDVREPTEYLFKTHCQPYKQRMYMYGTSLGGTIGGNYVFRCPDSHNFSGIVLYGAPLNPHKTEPYLRTNTCGIYDIGLGWHFRKQYKRTLPKMLAHCKDEKLAKYLQECADRPKSYRLTEYDATVVATMFGYSSSMEYYKDTSMMGNIDKFKVPTFCLVTNDDPLIHSSTFPVDEMLKNPNYLFGYTERGGHCCHL